MKVNSFVYTFAFDDHAMWVRKHYRTMRWEGLSRSSARQIIADSLHFGNMASRELVK